MEYIVQEENLLGKGWSSRVYKLNEKLALKVFSFDKPEFIREEFEKITRVNESGLPSAQGYGIVHTADGKTAILMEYVPGESFGNILLSGICNFKANKELLVSLLKQMASTPFKYEGENIKKYYIGKIRELSKKEILNEKTGAQILSVLEDIPDADTFSHGDLNFSNIIYNDGRLKLIDFSSCGYGDILFDLASVYRFFFQRQKSCPWRGLWRLKIWRRHAWMSILSDYYGTRDRKALCAISLKAALIKAISGYIFLVNNFPESEETIAKRAELDRCLKLCEKRKIIRKG